jgi:radical SAM protein with 4Fe4S-binding SPASM domain
VKKYNIGWGLTNACNMNCAFCYSKEIRSKIDDVSIKDWINFIDENHEQVDSINYGTGENSIINDFFSFIEYVRNKYPGITQAITTNGYISQRIKHEPNLFDIFIKSIDEIDVSLDFSVRAKHCDFRGQELAYDWAIETLELLKDTDKKVTIVFVGFEETLEKDNIDGLFSIAKKYNTLLRLNIYRPVSEQSRINEKFMLCYDTLMNALEYINEKYRIVGLSDVLIGNIYSHGLNIKENTGIGSIRILPNGKICPSTYLISEEYSNKYSIKDKQVLSKINFERFENAVVPAECHDCPILRGCKGGVYDRRILWYGTLNERDPYCPFRHGDSVIKDKFNIEEHGRISVHDDYLPTLFFKNKEDK